MKMLQHDLLTWTDISDDSDSWKNTGSKKFNSKKKKLIKKYKKIKIKITDLGVINEEKEIDVEEEQEAAKKMTHDMEKLELTTVDEEMEDAATEDAEPEMSNNREEYKTTTWMAVARRRRCDTVLAGGGDDRKDDIVKEERKRLMDCDNQEKSAGEFNTWPDDMDMLRGYMNCDTKIMSLTILDGILDNIEYENTQLMSPPEESANFIFNSKQKDNKHE